MECCLTTLFCSSGLFRSPCHAVWLITVLLYVLKLGDVMSPSLHTLVDIALESWGLFKVPYMFLVQMDLHHCTLFFIPSNSSMPLLSYFVYYCCIHIYVCICMQKYVSSNYWVCFCCVFDFRADHFVLITSNKTHPLKRIILPLWTVAHLVVCVFFV